MKDIYLSKEYSVEERVNDLLSKMTIDEKLNQMFITGINDIDSFAKEIKNGKKFDISCTFSYGAYDPKNFNIIQKNQIENTRLHIPVLLASENTHGVSYPESTVFPNTNLMAATFDENLVGKAANASAKEARALGIRQIYAPNIDISWDLRWGRVEENFGEDPYLTSVMGKAVVRNTQKEGVAATLKHYIAYGLPESGINLAPSHIGERDIREYMLPPFEECIKEGVWALMPTYSEIDGVPIHGSKRWMKDILRDELGFKGMVITDFGASGMMESFHHTCHNSLEVGKTLCDNEVDMEGGAAYGYLEPFRKLVKEGKYPIEKIDECVKNILRLKFRTGLFENPYIDEDYTKNIHLDSSLKLCKEISDKGIVLLKNDGILPLKKDMKVSLVGPSANNIQLGNYVYYADFDSNYHGRVSTSNAKSLKDVLDINKVNYKYSLGSDYNVTNNLLLEEAVNNSKDADVIILCVGSNSNKGTCCGNQEDIKDKKLSTCVTSGEGFDLNDIDLPIGQVMLFNKLAELNKPIILLLSGGRVHAITNQVNKSNAILCAFDSGEMGAYSMFDILYGNVNPSGKLPLSFPRSTGHLPCYYNHKPSARGSFYKKPGTIDNSGRDYVFDSPKSLFEFGYGLSYTKFVYSNLKINKIKDYEFEVSIDVKNDGLYDGDECVLCFLSAKCQEVTPVVKKLRHFTRISLKCGEKQTVAFRLNSSDFTYVGINYEKKLSYGTHYVMIGTEMLEFEV